MSNDSVESSVEFKKRSSTLPSAGADNRAGSCLQTMFAHAQRLSMFDMW